MGPQNGGEAAQQQALHQREESAHLLARGGVAQLASILGVAEISEWDRGIGGYHPIGNFRPTKQQADRER